MTNIIEADKITKIYNRGSEEVPAVRQATFNIQKGEIVTVTGPSGSGKTTLVNIIGCLDNLSSGSLKVDGSDIFKDTVYMSEAELTKVRRKFFGYVFQKFFLIPTLTVRENILLPSVFHKGLKAEDKAIRNILQTMGLEKRANHLPAQLSGGEMQRVAIARALIGNPPIIIADEPTGNLDTKRSDEIKDILLSLNKDKGVTIILVTHNPDLAKIGNSTLEMLDGKIQNRG